MKTNRTLIVGVAGAALAVAGLGIAQNLVKETKAEPVASMQALELQALKKKVSHKFINVKLADVLAWLSLEDLSFVADTSSFPDRTATLNFVNQPLGAVLDVVAKVYGGRWERKGEIFTLLPYLNAEIAGIRNWAGAKDAAALPEILELKMEPKDFWVGLKDGQKLDPQDKKSMEAWTKKLEGHLGKDFKGFHPEDMKAWAKSHEEWSKKFGEHMKLFEADVLKNQKHWEQFGKEFGEKWAKEFGDKPHVFEFKKMDPKERAELEKELQKLHGELKLELKDLDPQIRAKVEAELKDLPAKLKAMPLWGHEGKLEGVPFKDLDPKVRAKIEAELKDLPAKVKTMPFAGPDVKIESIPFGVFTPKVRAFGSTTIKLTELLESLSPEQKARMKDQGFLKASDLSAKQREMLGPLKGSWQIVFSKDGQKMTIKSG